MAPKQTGKRAKTSIKQVHSPIVIKGGLSPQLADYQSRPLPKPSDKSSRTKS